MEKKKIFIYLGERDRVSEQWGRAEGRERSRERKADSPLSREPHANARLNPRTERCRPEQKADF